MSPAPLDGNVSAGDLADIFAFDATTAVTTCATCRAAHPIATLRAYMRAPGVVLRCASCDAVQIRLVRSPLQAWLDLRGIDMLAMPATAAIRSTDDVAPSRIDQGPRAS
jgi:hypothetical protein